MDRQCSIGDVLKDECNQKTYTRKIGFKQFGALAKDEQEKILWRCGLLDTFSVENVTICIHHEMVYGRVFERRVSDKCCDVFKVHQKRVKGQHTVTLDVAKKLKASGYDIKPGLKICRNCHEQILQQNEKSTGNFLDEEGIDEVLPSSVHGDNDDELDISREQLNLSFQSSGVSPLKLHGATKSRQISTAKSKIKRVQQYHTQQAAKVIGVSADTIVEYSCQQGNQEKMEEKEKAMELDKLHFLLKEKISSATRRDKIKLLTLAPDSWSRERTAKFFNVSEYLVRTSRTLKKNKGILGEPESKLGRSLAAATVSLVIDFYQDDEFSRMMPSKKDFVSLGRNQHAQKRPLLCNLHELYSAFKKKHPDAKIGFSKFCSLRPKWCILTGASGTHSVCVCSQHQNAVLLVDAINWSFSYKDLMNFIVCDIDDRECMVHRCPKCPGKDALIDFVTKEISEIDDEVVHFQQWQSTDRPTLVSLTARVSEYITLVTGAVDELTTHSFIAKCQSKYLKECKENLDSETCIVLMDFAENYKYVIQDEIQAFHWNNQQCTLHPVVCYYRDETSSVKAASLCFISDDNDHDTCFVYNVQNQVTDYLKANLPNIKKVNYFTDGCAAQYKNYKNFLNLTFHKDDFGINADWTFFASSHGKSPCDGIGGTVKRLVARASLQRPLSDQIITFNSFRDYVTEHIISIKFFVILSKDMDTIRKKQNERFKLGRTIPGTRSFHYFLPTEDKRLLYKRTSMDPNFTGEHSFNIREPRVSIDQCKAMGYVSCLYDNLWWIGLVMEIDRDSSELKVNFMHPHGPSNSFLWPNREDTCWVPIEHVICTLATPTTKSGRMYTINKDDMEKISAHVR